MRVLTLLVLLGGAAGKPPPEIQPAVKGPNVNGISLEDPGLPAAQDKYVAAGFVNAAGPPFNADSSGKTDATKALQSALDFGRAHYLTIFLPSGTYVVNSTLKMVQDEKWFISTSGTPNCNNMIETSGAPTNLSEHCGRTQPHVLQGNTKGERATLLVKQGTGLNGYVVQVHNPINENINMNQVVSSIDITIEGGNPEAMGIYARGAQGVSVQDVTIRAVDAAVGLDGGAGSGGSHADVTVIGGKIGARMNSAQPAPTISGLTLINQTVTALQYGKPGRQTLSVSGVQIQTTSSASGAAIDASYPLSILDASLECLGGGCATGVSVKGGQGYFNNVFLKGFTVPFDFGGVHPVPSKAGWVNVAELAVGNPSTRPIYVDRTPQNATTGDLSVLVGKVDEAAPPKDLVSRHVLEAIPSWLDEGVCDAKQRGAKGDLQTDDTKALRAVLADPQCSTVFLPKGYYGVTGTLEMRAGQVLLGAGRIFSNIVPHPSVTPLRDDKTPAWPLLQTASGNVIDSLSLLVWRYINSTYAVSFKGETVWRRAHTNRVDLSPGKDGPPAYYNQPLNTMTGGKKGSVSRFWNFYQENWYSQGPKYRHLLVTGLEMGWTCYHCNTEHSQGEANLEIADSTGPVAIHGFKGEGNYVQIWVRNSTSFFLLGYGGNASPFPFECYYPPGYAPYSPSLLRLENVGKVTIANLVSQLSSKHETKCGIFDTGFAGSFYDPSVWRTLLEITPQGNTSTPPNHWPALYKH